MLETVPAGVFSEYDTSGLKLIYLHGNTAFADGTALTIPSGCTFRFQLGNWTPDPSVPNRWNAVSRPSETIEYSGDIVNNGQMNVTGDGNLLAPFQIYSGNISGSGKFYV